MLPLLVLQAAIAPPPLSARENPPVQDGMVRMIEALVTNTTSKFERPASEPAKVESDFGPHPRQAQDYWGLSGWLRASDGRDFGVRVGLVRTGLLTPAEANATVSAWRPAGVYFAWLDVLDVAGQSAFRSRRLSREAHDLSAAGPAPVRIWVEDWQWNLALGGTTLQMYLPTQFGFLDLQSQFRNQVPTLASAADAEGPLRFYAVTRLATAGTLPINGRPVPVTGELWFERSWGRIPLSTGLMTVDRMHLQLDDGRDIDLSVVRRRSGESVPVVRCSIVSPDAPVKTLTGVDLQLTFDSNWGRPFARTEYPSSWHIAVPDQGMDFDVLPVSGVPEDQHDWLPQVRLVTVKGNKMHGVGYVQHSGYVSEK